MRFPSDDKLLTPGFLDEEVYEEQARFHLAEYGDAFRSQLLVARSLSLFAESLTNEIDEADDPEWDFARAAAIRQVVRMIRDGDFLPGSGGYNTAFDDGA